MTMHERVIEPKSDPVGSTVNQLLEAMGRGDRDAAAEFVTRYGPLIRRRIRGKLRASMRRLFDSQDILSTLSRRLDRYVHSRQFEARSEAELWSLVYTIAERSVVEKAIIWRALTKKEGGFARQMSFGTKTTELPDQLDLTADGELEQLLGSIPLAVDRQIARLWAIGKTSEEIGSETGLSASDVRQRWQRTKTQLRAMCTKDSL